MTVEYTDEFKALCMQFGCSPDSFLDKFWAFIKGLIHKPTPPGPEPVTVKRFFAGFQFLNAGIYPSASHAAGTDSTLQFFSTSMTDADRQWYIDKTKADGNNAIFFLVLNAGPANNVVTFYKDINMPGGEVDPVKLANYKTWFKKIRDAGLIPMPIMQCCEHAPDKNQTWVNKLSSSTDKICADIMPAVEEYNPIWTSLLEAEKSIDGAGTERICKTMAKYTKSPIGVHTSKIEYGTGPDTSYTVKFVKEYNHGERKIGDIMTLNAFLGYQLIVGGFCILMSRVAGVDFIAYEWGGDPWTAWNNIKPTTIYSDTRRLMGNLRGNKRLLPCEFSVGRLTDNNIRQGLAAAFNETDKIVGVGSGEPKNLYQFMIDLPGGMTSSINGNIITMVGGGVTAIANLQDATYRRG